MLNLHPVCWQLRSKVASFSIFIIFSAEFIISYNPVGSLAFVSRT